MIDQNSTFGGFLTDIGEAKQANANALGQPWKLTHMLLGDANGTDPVPQPGQTQLINQVYRAAINQLFVDPANPAILIAELVLPPNVGGWWIRELGLEDEDGDFVAVANCPPSYKPLLTQGSGRNQVVRMHLIVSNTANVQLKIDPSVVLATRKYVDDGDAAVKAHIEQGMAAAGYQFASYDAERVYTTGEIVRGSDGLFYEFYDRDLSGTTQGIDPTNIANRPHIWMQWDGVRPGTTIEWRSESLPEGYVENDGGELNRSDYRRIFAAFGTTYGVGDGSTTFVMPDDRGEFKRGLDRGRGVDPGRTIGSGQLDQMQRITGTLLAVTASGVHHLFSDGSGAFSVGSPGAGLASSLATGANRYGRANFDSAGSPGSRTGDSTFPRNNAVIYLTKI
ncbi:phage tail protein [Halomonas sp. MCCC 1A17488]|uniref:phage tail-collar fiber domain-containing protein n=1 Tax=unclassified Halomonas TaxID=2609666 RepID=UPI0018D25B1A|nr:MULTISPECIES: phage tail protein [unclassified Halomonas]MCE8015916.1 phage tail protein [Halomonas sp. MCCC 1A17488]MCG3239249.1 phage tail protein [Halomonas sp. MCCC 1A17488]QPP50816.1 phage tail protein [Halomonas sp. SS10-MC5]